MPRAATPPTSSDTTPARCRAAGVPRLTAGRLSHGVKNFRQAQINLTAINMDRENPHHNRIS